MFSADRPKNGGAAPTRDQIANGRRPALTGLMKSDAQTCAMASACES